MESGALVVANPDWYTPFAVAAVLNLTVFFVWTMQSLIGSRPMVVGVLTLGIATGIGKMIDPMAHRVLASLLLLAILGFCIHFSWKTWPRARWMALANAIMFPISGFTGYMVFYA